MPPINLITDDPKSVEKFTEKPTNISVVIDGKSTKIPPSTRIPKNETWIAVEVKEETVTSSTVSPPPSSSPSYSRRPDEQPSQPRKENDPPMIPHSTDMPSSKIPSSDRKDTRKDSRRPVPTPGMIPGEGMLAPDHYIPLSFQLIPEGRLDILHPEISILTKEGHVITPFLAPIQLTLHEWLSSRGALFKYSLVDNVLISGCPRLYEL